MDPEAPAPTTTLADEPPLGRDVRKRLWLDVAAVLAVAFVPPLYSALREYLAPSRGPIVMGDLDDSLSTFVSCACVCVVLLYVHLRSGDGPDAAGLARQRLFPLVVASLMVWAVQRWIYAYMWAAIRTSFPYRQVTLHAPRGLGEAAALVAAEAANALQEELAMRALLIDRLARLTGRPLLSAISAAVLFGSYHLYQDVHGALWAFVFGLLQGILFLLTRRLWPLVIGHALCNLEYYLR